MLLQVPVTAKPLAATPKDGAPSLTMKTMISLLLRRKTPSVPSPCEAGLPTRWPSALSTVAFCDGTVPPKLVHVPPPVQTSARPLARSHGVPGLLPPAQVAPLDSIGGPGGFGKTMVGTLANVVMPTRRVSDVVAAGGHQRIAGPGCLRDRHDRLRSHAVERDRARAAGQGEHAVAVVGVRVEDAHQGVAGVLDDVARQTGDDRGAFDVAQRRNVQQAAGQKGRERRDHWIGRVVRASRRPGSPCRSS